MPCTLSTARARHAPQNACPATNLCCDSRPSFSSKQVCCGDDENFDTEWTPYDLVITATTTDPVYTLTEGSRGYYKVSGKSLFVKFNIQLASLSVAGSGDYLFSLPTGLTFANPTDVGSFYIDDTQPLPYVGTIIRNNNFMKLGFHLSFVLGTPIRMGFINSANSNILILPVSGDIHIRLE